MINASPLLNPLALPLRSHNTIAGSALVVAPHPDDETLGCGGAIALLRASGYPVHVVVVSDGTLSHPNSLKYPRLRLRELRQAETETALANLGVEATAITFLQFPDGAIPAADASAIARCCIALEQLVPEIVFLPWRSDPHPDHRATWILIQTALNTLNQSPRIIEYPIWDWDPEQREEMTQSVSSWRLDIAAVLAQKQSAIAAYRSQTTNLIDDDPEGFQLTSEMLANFARPWELYLEEAP